VRAAPSQPISYKYRSPLQFQLFHYRAGNCHKLAHPTLTALTPLPPVPPDHNLIFTTVQIELIYIRFFNQPQTITCFTMHHLAWLKAVS
jgi:hypothetical protein